MVMEKYYVLDTRKLEEFGGETPFDTPEEALNSAAYQWAHMTKSEQKSCVSFEVVKGEADEDGYLDCVKGYDSIKTYK